MRCARWNRARRIEPASDPQVKRASRIDGSTSIIFETSHKTTYTYSRPVFLELHHLRLRPRSDGVQHLAYFASKVEPRPSGSADGLDLDGNCVENVWFQGLTEKLIVESRAKVITQYRNPFNYILAERADRLPVTHQDPLQAYLAPYTVRRNESHLIEQFARHIANRTEWKTLRFLTMLTRHRKPGCLFIAALPILRRLRRRRTASSAAEIRRFWS